jgi:DNA-binding response OmpR family regulator
MVNYLIEDDVLKNAKALVLENDEVNQLLIKIMLENNNLLPTVISDSSKVTEYLQSEKYDVLILDMSSKRPSSFEVVEEIRKGLKLSIPIIGLSMKDYRDRALYHGIDIMLQRPIENRTLIYHIMRALYKSQKNDPIGV